MKRLKIGWIGIGLLVLVLGGQAMAKDEITREALERQTDRLQAELRQLRKQVVRLSGAKNVERPEGLNKGSRSGKATQADLDRAMEQVRQDLADLALAIYGLTPREPLEKPQKVHRKQVSTSGAAYRIRVREKVRNRTVRLANRGWEVVVNPRLIVNGKRDWFSTASILEETLAPGMSDRENAVAIWQFLKDNRYHDSPAHNDVEVHDPVRFMNVYGYGFCDDSATNFMVLAEAAGLKARVWGLSGHVVPEAYFDGGWHMLDPDGEIYYLDDDGESISSVKTLEQRPDIIRKYPSPYYTDAEKLIEIYSTTEDNRIAEGYRRSSEAVHTMGFVLRPGESLLRSWDNWGLYFADRYLEAPRQYGNGRFRFEPVFEDGLFQKGSKSVRGVQVEEGVLVASQGRKGVLVYPFQSPYPILGGKIDVVGDVQGKGGIEVLFSENGEDWQTVWKVDEPGVVKAEVPMGGYFRNGYGRPVYAYFLQVSLSGTASVRKLVFESDVQVAPHSLPTLEEGENTVRYVDESKGERQVGVTFAYDGMP